MTLLSLLRCPSFNSWRSPIFFFPVFPSTFLVVSAPKSIPRSSSSRKLIDRTGKLSNYAVLPCLTRRRLEQRRLWRLKKNSRRWCLSPTAMNYLGSMFHPCFLLSLTHHLRPPPSAKPYSRPKPSIASSASNSATFLSPWSSPYLLFSFLPARN